MGHDGFYHTTRFEACPECARGDESNRSRIGLFREALTRSGVGLQLPPASLDPLCTDESVAAARRLWWRGEEQVCEWDTVWMTPAMLEEFHRRTARYRSGRAGA